METLLEILNGSRKGPSSPYLPQTCMKCEEHGFDRVGDREQVSWANSAAFGSEMVEIFGRTLRAPYRVSPEDLRSSHEITVKKGDYFI